MGDDITIGVTEIVNNIEVTAQPNDQIVDISVIDNADEVTLNITPTVIEINVNKGSSYARWGTIYGNITDQTDLQNDLLLKADLVDGKVPAYQLPSFVDDIIEVANYAALPATGETGKIYVTLDNNKIYRWSGSIYIEIAANNAIWGSITGTLSNQTDLQNALNAKFNNPTGNTTQYIAGDGSLITFPIAGQSGTLVREVRNTSGATLTKGTVVYINGANGNKPTVAKAIATGDSTSAQTFGIIQADLANNANGYVVCVGDIVGLDTSAITEGTQLYLSSTTAGAYTTTKQLAPAHLVYIGIVTRSHPTLGQIEVKIQNGYELDEIHDVAISSKANNQILAYESATDLWKNKSIATVLGYTPANDASVVKLTGDQSITGSKSFTTNTAAPAMVVTNNSTDNGILLQNTSTGRGITSNNVSSSTGIYSSNSSTGTGIYSLNSSTGTGIISDNTSTGRGLYLQNSSSGRNLILNNTTASTGMPFTIAKNNSDVFTINDAGEATGVKFIKSGGTSSQFLKADGSIDSTTYQTALTNPVTGTGTSGHVAFWNGTSSISGESNLFWDSTNDRLGIGTTTSLSYRLQVGTAVGTAASVLSAINPILYLDSGSSLNNSIVIKTHSAGNGNSNGSIKFASSPDGLNYSWSGIAGITNASNSAANLAFYTASSNSQGTAAGASTEQMRIFTTGNITIQNGGTFTDAGFRLDVNGTVRVQGAFTATADSTINGVNIGKGGGAIVTNTRVGESALNSNTTGSNNSAFGRNSMFSNTTGSQNTSIGDRSLQDNTTGLSNISFGYQSGRYIADGTTANTITNQSIYIGVNTKALANNQTNQIVIGHNATGLGSNTTVLGNSSTTTTAIYGSVGIGTTSPATKLQVVGTGVGGVGTIGIKGESAHLGLQNAAGNFKGWFGYYNLGAHGSDVDLNIKTGYNGSSNILFGTTADSGEAMRITSNGELLIGRTSPYGAGWLVNVEGNIYAKNDLRIDGGGSFGGSVGIGTTTSPVSALTVGGLSGGVSTPTAITMDGTYRTGGDSFSSLKFYLYKDAVESYGLGLGDLADLQYWAGGTSTGQHRFFTSRTERMRITSGGDVLINKTSLSAGTVGVEFERNSTSRMTADGNTVLLLNRLTSDGTIVDFRRSTTQVGSISVTTVMTSYNVTSDYRLKQDFKPFKGLDLVSKIKVYDYEWKADNSRMNGVIAHELQEVVPYAVTGEKDAKEMQQVDYSKLVPILVQAIQELQEKINKLENK